MGIGRFSVIRRSRFAAGGAALLSAPSILRAPAKAAEFTYKLAHANPVDFPPDVRLVQMAHAVKSETNGRMVIDIYPNSVLGSQTSMLAQLRLGSIQLFSAASLNLGSVIPVASIDSIGFAFSSPERGWRALDGPLGAYLRQEFEAKGLHVFERCFENGMRQITSSSKPIRGLDDLAGFKLRTAPSPVFVDFFRALGAAPVALDATELYPALQTHIVDGQETPILIIESYRLYEVQRFVSLTNHIWSASWLTANGDAWKALPADIQAVVSRNAAKYALLARRDMQIAAVSVVDKLKRQGMAVNAPDTAPMKARMSGYYAKWKNELGTTAWSLLEASVGRLG